MGFRGQFLNSVGRFPGIISGKRHFFCSLVTEVPLVLFFAVFGVALLWFIMLRGVVVGGSFVRRC